MVLFGAGLRNVDCADTNSTEPPGCAYKWCEYTPAIKDVQFYLSYAVNSLSFPYCISICQAMFVSEIYKEFGTYWTYGTTAGSFVAAALVTLLTWKRLIPIQKRIQMEK